MKNLRKMEIKHFGILEIFVIVVALLGTCCFAEKLEEFGNVMHPTRGNQEQNNTLIFLDPVTMTGRLIGYRFWFNNDANDLYVVVYRPISPGSATANLIHMTKVVPTVTDGVQDVHLMFTGEKCILVEVGDRVGIYQPLAPGPVSKRFGIAMMHVMDVSNKDISLNTPLEINTLSFPEEYSFKIFVNTEDDPTQLDAKDCPSMTIPPYNQNPDVPSTTLVPITGAPGIKGDQGLKGDVGPKGDKGSDGVKGDKGDLGLLGPPGLKGQDGLQGLKGSKGDIGGAGLKGEKGLKGDLGALGGQGDTGMQGFTGLQGVNGDTGPTGLRGIQGIKGDEGEKGDIGIAGSKGEAGNAGAPGPRGPQGVEGPTGPAGIPGRNVTFDGNYTHFIQGPPGPKGDRGDQGTLGPAGAQGIQGVQGNKGEPGTPGKDGINGKDGASGGVKGERGLKGERGPTGPPGPAGTDFSGGAAAARSSDDEGFFDGSTVAIIMFIWLIIITVVMIIQCLCCAYFWNRRKKEERRKENFIRADQASLAFYDSLGDPGTMRREKEAKNKPDKLKLYDPPKPYEGIQPTTPGGPRSPNNYDDDYKAITRNLSFDAGKSEMMSHMREDTFQEYNNDTIDRAEQDKRNSLYKRNQSTSSGRHLSSSGTMARNTSVNSEPPVFMGSTEAVFAVDNNSALVTMVSVAEDNDVMKY